MKKADEAWNRRAQPANEPCTDCSGIVYRQTNSGKIIPADQRCGAKITPPCYQPDGDGCAYQIYGDNNDEPIERCKACPLCYSDKVRHKDPANEPPVRCGECANYQTQNCAAERDGRRVELPCKIGSMVYMATQVFDGSKTKWVIGSRKIDMIGGNALNSVWAVSTQPYELHFVPSEFGRSVFLTRTEAEAALKDAHKQGGEQDG